MGKNRWSILHEDDHIIVIEKPAGLLVLPDRFDSEIQNLQDDLIKYRGEIFVNHRLDKDTSGVILFSKTAEAHKAFSDIFENRKIEKLYYTIVHGTPIEEVGQIDLNIGISRNKRKQMVIDQKGKRSITKYRTVKSWGLFSLLEVKILTGRMHQIRVHMQAINCPILCDNTYGIDDSFYLSQIKRKYRRSGDKVERPLLHRMALHAHTLKFIHPFTKEEAEYKCEMPKDMKAVEFQLDKLS